MADAVRGRWLAPDDARVIYVTRVLGHTPAEVAAAVGRDVRVGRAQRRRAERCLERRCVTAGALWTRRWLRRSCAGPGPPVTDQTQRSVTSGCGR